MFQPLVLSVPAFDATGTPFSTRYGEPYRAAQAQAWLSRQVFVAGAGLPARWQGREQFTVFDTSFGLGLNFLATWAAWRDDPARSTRLHMVAVDPHPFERAGLERMLHGCVPPAWRDLANQLLAHWPPMTPGMHRLDLDQGRVSLTLALGSPRELVPQLSFRADAFYLDGFGPAVNPEPWADELLRAAARRAAPGATLATWCDAESVRRTLVTAGFEIEQHAASDHTPAMTTGRYAPRYVPRNVAPPPPEFAERRAVVIGAGIAGAGVAHALAWRGWQVEVLDAGRFNAGPFNAQGNGTAPGLDAHAGHVAAALTPLIARDDSPRARLARAGTLRAHARWLAHAPAAAAVLACGTVQQMRNDSQEKEAQATVAALDFPPEWLQAVDRETASRYAGLPLARGGFWFPRGMRVQPGLLCQGLLDMPGITRRQASADRVQRVPADVPGGEVWLVLDATGQTLASAEVIVFAASVDVPGLLARSGLGTTSLDGMQAVSGQIARVPAAGIDPRCVVAGEGYLLPAIDGKCVVGSTYVYNANAPTITASGRDTVLAKLAGLLPDLDLDSIRPADLDDWAGWRAVLPQRMPVIGALPGAPGVWLATAYASRGLSWSALAGELIATQLAGEPVPLERSLLASIAPM